MTFSKLYACLRTEQRVRMAALADTKLNHLWQLAGGHRQPSIRLAWRLVLASREMFPNNKRRWLSMEGFARERERQQALKRPVKRPARAREAVA